MKRMDRLPAVPVIATDPYLSIWMPADTMGETDTIHWSGPVKPVRVSMNVDGRGVRVMGAGERAEATPEELIVTATTTRFASSACGVRIEAAFTTPDLPDDLALTSMPVTLVSLKVRAVDGRAHDVSLSLYLSDRLCYSGQMPPEMFSDTFPLGNFNVALCGQAVQKPLSGSGDHVTIDWGYLYLASQADVAYAQSGLKMTWKGRVGEAAEVRAVIAYDDIASINYFGSLCKPLYTKDGATIIDAIRTAAENFDDIAARCAALDARVQADAEKVSRDYADLINATWRHVFCAHKLIAAPSGEMAFLSKENDSNGCIGTVDLSYPSMPMFLKYCPELVNAMCRPILEFASMPVWTDDFAPHDVGRYPYATGQVYAARNRRSRQPGHVFPPYYLYPGEAGVYDIRYQMPVEECGNMLIMLYAAQAYGADQSLAEKYGDTLKKWVQYLIEYGEDPGEQLCTDDFAGHLAHNVNLSAKAIVGVACYGRMTGEESWVEHAKGMARRLMDRIGRAGDTPLTLDGTGWSMKYNLLWDRVLRLGLFPDEFYDAETRSYLKRINRYGLPLDSRADYTKSDWMAWTAALADDPAVRDAILAPLVRTLHETGTRLPFSDWYDTNTGRMVSFIGRSVQGGLYAPMLRW